MRLLEELEYIWYEYGGYVIDAVRYVIMAICAIVIVFGFIAITVLTVVVSWLFVLLIIPEILLFALFLRMLDKWM